MVLKTYGYKRFDCGCVKSLDIKGRTQGFAEECEEVREIFTAMFRDKRGCTREVEAEWKAKFDEHTGESDV